MDLALRPQGRRLPWRGELRNALRAQGLREQDSSGDGERDVFAVAHKRPGARQLVVSYLRGAQSRLLQVAELNYRFPTQGPAEIVLTSQRLRSALQGKYRQAVCESAPLRWRSDDGVDIELRTEPSHDLLLSYRIAERVAVRDEQQRRKVQLAAERLVALTARALARTAARPAAGSAPQRSPAPPARST